MHRQSKIRSTSAVPRSHGLPKPFQHDLDPPQMTDERKPRTICRNFIYNGVCDNMQCPRAHVPHHNMHSIFEFLLKRNDCPAEVRSIQPSSFSRPSGKRRQTLPSDYICFNFLRGVPERMGCPRAHLSYFQIYNSLPRTVKLETTTAMAAPMHVTDGPPVVRLPSVRFPGETEYPSQHSFDPLYIVRLPETSISNRQDSVSSPLGPIVCIPRHTGTQLASSDRIAEIELQQNYPETPTPSLQVSESIVESSLGSNSAMSKSTVADVLADVLNVGNAPVATNINHCIPTTSHPKHPREICRDWWYGRCYRNPCRFLHPEILPPQIHGYNFDDPYGPQTVHPYGLPAAQTNAMRVPVPDRTIFSSTHKPQFTGADAVKRDPAVFEALPSIPSCPPYSLQKPASAIPADTSTQVCLPSNLQEQSPPPKYTPPDETTLSVMESTQVIFSSGFSVEKITTGFESVWFVIEAVPITVDRAAIEKLVAPFGEAQDVRFRDERRSGDPASKAVTLRMATYHEAVRAVNELDGSDAFGRRISVQLSLSKRLTKRLLRDSVRVSWPVPCKAGYAGYSTLEAAQNAVSKADGTTIQGHWITASMYQSIPFIADFNVRFTGLPPGVNQKFLDKFGPSEGTMLERPNHQAPDCGIPAVRRTLGNFGKITRFKVIPPPYKEGFVRVWCQFESPDVARAACELNKVKQRALNMERITVDRVLSFLERVPRAKFDLVERDLLHLQEKVWDHTRGAHLEILPPCEGEAAVRLEAKDSKTLARLKVELKEILDGEIVKENGQQVWDDFLRCKAGLQFLEELRRSDADVMISVHSFRRYIRLIGSVERRQSVAAAILAKLSSRRQDKVHILPLDGQVMGVVASPELVAAQQRHGEENIHIDLQGHALLVRGSDDLYEEVQRIVHSVKSRHVADFGGNDHCPVCLELPLTPVSLSCGQRWCKSCLAEYMTAAADTRSFPITCLGDQGRCTELIPMWMARKVLPPTDFDALALAAFHAYVQAHPGEYHYCPTPDCPQAYPTGPRNVPLSCPSCLARICSSCHVEYHEGVTCADREDGGDRLFQEWMQIHDVKKCPGCHAPIERAAGCNHMTCTRCHTHTCWVCLETFPQGQGIYDHMREFHGGIGL